MAQNYEPPEVFQAGVKENKFNMGIASLMAIRKKMDEFYVFFAIDRPVEARSSLEVIYWECYSDFTKDERTACDKALKEIADLINKYNEENATVEGNKRKGRNVDQLNLIKAKGNLWNAMRDFYHKQLLVAMDTHDLLRPKKDDPRFAVFN